MSLSSSLQNEMEKDFKSPPSHNNAHPRMLGDVESTLDISLVEVDKPFRLWSTLAIQCSISSTPLAIGTYLSIVIGVGGSPVYFFGYILSGLMSLCVCISLAEIAAAFPHASGQIYWTAALSPKKYSRALSYTVGWLTCAAWFFAAAATFLFTSQLIWALVLVFKTTFILQAWHYYMVYIACAVLALAVNLPLFKMYPYLLNGLVPFLNIGSLFIMIALLVRAHPKQSADFVFADFVNATGWTSDGVVFFLGLLPGIASLIGFDAAAHMTEELPNPRQQVPKIMIYGVIINFLTGIPMILTYEFCIVNAANLLVPVGGEPIIQLFVDSFDMLALTVISSLALIICFLFGGTTILTVFSRTWWAFANENGIPFSGFLGTTNEKLQLPVNSIFFCFFACVALGAIQLGSTLALNAFAGALVISFYASYSVPILALLVNRRQLFPVDRYCNLGKFGPVINVIALGWQVMMFVWLCFPIYIPVNGATMNYSIVVFSGVMLLSGINWFSRSRKTFTVPSDRTEAVR